MGRDFQPPHTLMFERPVRLETPIQTTHTFVGGPLDGQRHKATVHFAMTDKTIVKINGANYRYIGNDTLQFIGTEARPPALWERIQKRIFG